MTRQSEHIDVLIIGAGISGIGAAHYLQTERPGSSYAILEARGVSGGTWALFRYPGIRSDSDLHTFGYAFKPWRNDKSIATADLILDYLRETAGESGIEQHIRYHHKVRGAAWSTAEARWTVEIERADTGETVSMTANWLFCAGGYYRYDEGFTPRFEGRERFAGQIVHPQHWPEDLDCAGKKVVVIGSGATAVTLIPALADTAGHVTMLQRSPTYILPVASEDVIANTLRKVLPASLAYRLTRRKNIAMQRFIWRTSQRHPRIVRRLIRAVNIRQLPAGYPVDEHFNPSYDPWDQRLCTVPDADLFKALKKGAASVVTDRIATFTETGIRLESGRELDADIIVTATGLNVQLFGGMALSVDGEPVDFADKVAFKGMMLSGVPNFAFAIGYTNSSWTLKVGLLCEHFTRLLGHMDATGADICRPELPDPAMPTRPLLDFGAGYVKRSLHVMPRQGLAYPWLMSMNYHSDVKLLRGGPVEDDNLQFTSVARHAKAQTSA
ncbi:flavin-containing monooxygenase [Streptomyces olivochromogenes]|uniref:Flavin-binding monooxygenase n=1 Tax=Streptomyces olivochromogenes TaxID=1963 RepID=A0A250VKG8_STROL|nr:NAD(P)/FAD-dependent oxidoreductase [Streptomyces olivochromogenes]KUN42843.1 FAD-containing monooxygenase EthA [Streptomyces olivochromogenes]GAX54584.1 flavin-binding monooxygenase [Streptomyces olivochromogenes]